MISSYDRRRRQRCRDCIVLGILLHFFVFVFSDAGDSACDETDAAIRKERQLLCNSLVQGDTEFCGTDWRPYEASHDWPSQAVYFISVLDAIVDAADGKNCSDTPYYRDTIAWLNDPIIDANISGNFGWTWLVFQVQYYDMPRKPGNRIESPDTLGRKCWAMAFLTDAWRKGAYPSKIPETNNMTNVTKFVTYASNYTMDLCARVQENCFVNASYDPTRNGTCTRKQLEFHYLGFDRENLKRFDPIRYPFY